MPSQYQHQRKGHDHGGAGSADSPHVTAPNRPLFGVRSSPRILRRARQRRMVVCVTWPLLPEQSPFDTVVASVGAPSVNPPFLYSFNALSLRQGN